MGDTGSYRFTEFYQVLPKFIDFFWLLLSNTGFYRIIPSFSQFYWIFLGDTGSYWSFTEFYQVLPKSIEFFWLLLSNTGFYWIIPSFFKIYWNLLGDIGSYWVFTELDQTRTGFEGDSSALKHVALDWKGRYVFFVGRLLERTTPKCGKSADKRPSNRWRPISRRMAAITRPDGSSLKANRL